MAAKPKNMAAVQSSVRGVSKFRYLKGTVEWTVRFFNISPWHYETYGRHYAKRAWNREKVLFDIQGMEINFNLNLQSARHHTLKLLEVELLWFSQARVSKKSLRQFLGQGCRTADLLIKTEFMFFFFSFAFVQFTACSFKGILLNSKSCRIWRTYSTQKL